MKSGICFTGTGPILVLTTYDSFANEDLLKKFASKGIKKFIVYELPVELVKEKYGMHYTIVLNDLKQESDLRVLDYDGHHIFYLFSLKELGEPFIHDDTD
jgi:hypothetical protein